MAAKIRDKMREFKFKPPSGSAFVKVETVSEIDGGSESLSYKRNLKREFVDCKVIDAADGFPASAGATIVVNMTRVRSIPGKPFHYVHKDDVPFIVKGGSHGA